MKQTTIFIQFLSLLKVKYAAEYSNKVFNKQWHKYNLFGLSSLPSDYTIEDAATRISNNVYVQYVFSSFNFICKYLIAARIENGYKLPDNHKIEDLRYFTEI